MLKLRSFFYPRSVAIIGASNKKGKIGNILLENLSPFKGKVYPVNPKHRKIGSLKCYPSVLDIETGADLAIIAIPAAAVPKAVEECAWHSRPIRNIIIISAGFSESGAKGKKLEEKIGKLAEEYQLNILGPNCLGIINNLHQLNASFAKKKIKSGKLGLIMQSGAFTTALADLVKEENMGIALVATLGNKAQLSEVELLEFFLAEKKVEVVGMYLEDIKDGKRLTPLLRTASKPVLILKAGNSPRAKQAIQSHTGALAGEADVARTAIEENGGLYFDNLRSFWSTLKFLSSYQLPTSQQMVIVTNAGGPGVVTTDLIERSSSLALANLGRSFQQRLKKVLPPACSVENPIDVLGDADSQRYQKAITALRKEQNLGAAIIIITPQAQTDVTAIGEVIGKANQRASFPIVPVTIGASSAQEMRSVLKKYQLDNFVFPSDAISALEKAIQLKICSCKPIVCPKRDSKTAKTASRLYQSVRANERKVFLYQEGQKLVEIYGIKAVTGHRIAKESDINKLKINFPAVLKVDDSNILHKMGRTGVVLNIENKSALKQAYWKACRWLKGAAGWIVQEQLPIGTEIILGIKKDDIFGKILLCGMGGILTEIIEERIIWTLPVTEKEVRRRLAGTKLEKILEKQKISLTELIKEIMKVARLGEENNWIKELDINPLIMYSGKASQAVDIKVIIE